MRVAQLVQTLVAFDDLRIDPCVFAFGARANHVAKVIVDPDFEEFDLPKSKAKKSAGTAGAAGAKKTPKGGEEEDLGFDDEFKDMDLFNDSGGFDEEEDDF